MMTGRFLRHGVVARIESMIPDLTGALRQVAEYIVEHPNQVVGLSIMELARRAGASETAVVRLAQRLEYRGFRELQVSLAYDLGSQNHTQDEEVEVDEGMDSIAAKVYAANSQALSDSFHILDTKALDQAVEAMAHARRISVFGQGLNAATAVDLHYNLSKLGLNCGVYIDPYMQAIAAATATPDDVVIGISHTGSNRDLIESIAIAKQHGARAIALTNHMGSPITRISDISLFTAPKEIVFRGEPLTSRLSALYLVDVLFIGIALRLKGEAVHGTFRRVQEALEGKRGPYRPMD
ncbi:MAG TPA: MurR/RpiR family transcriptional regulator [Trueperaceae bacterium]